MAGRMQFDLWFMLMGTALVAVLLAAWQIAGYGGVCVASLLLGAVLFCVSLVRSSRSAFVVSISLLLFYVIASLVTVGR